MKLTKKLGVAGLAVVLLGGVGAAWQAVEVSDLTLPWSRMASLSPEQVQQIDAIHQKALDEMRAIREKRDADIIALLDEEQRAELETVHEQLREERRQRRVEREAERLAEDAEDAEDVAEAVE
jgi:hypothetical protein